MSVAALTIDMTYNLYKFSVGCNVVFPTDTVTDLLQTGLKSGGIVYSDTKTVCPSFDFVLHQS